MNTRMLTVPNVLTAFRLVLTPYVFLAITHAQDDHALILLCVAGLSDVLDGWIARSWNQNSRLGACLDPIADKLLMGGVWIALGVRALVPWWAVVALVLRDILIVGGSLVIHLKRYGKTPPLWSGKLNTFLQLTFMIGCLVGQLGFDEKQSYEVILTWGLGLVGVWGVISFCAYGVAYVRQRAHRDSQTV